MKKALILCATIGIALVSFLFIQWKMGTSAIQLRAQQEEIKLNEKLREEAEIKTKKEVAQQMLFAKLKAKADTALAYCKDKGLDLDHCFLVDFSIHSGKNRFFTWNFKKDTIEFASICCHGVGNRDRGFKSTPSKVVFSNVEGSYCSSLGKYKTGERIYSRWGANMQYPLHGLEKTNSNSYKRAVSLHSYQLVSDKEIYPKHIPLGYSQGCTIISDNHLRMADELLKQKNRAMLLWIYQ